jgi:hypothetical protein
VSKRVRTFLYILPNEHSITTSSHPALERLGLGHLKGTSLVHSRVVGGPGGAAGSLIMALPTGAEEHEGKCAYLPEQQVWMEGPGYWIGAYRDAMPRPEDLERPERLDGYPLVLGNQNRWLVPIARAFDGTEQLPRRVYWGPDGKPIREVLPQYRAFSARVGKAAEQLYSGESVHLDPDDALSLCVEALAVNYRVGPYECSMLDLFSPEAAMVRNIVWAVSDFPRYSLVKESLKNGDTPQEQDSTSAG